MIYCFGPFELDSTCYTLRRSGNLVPLERRVFDVLLLLIQNAGRVVTKEEIFATIWAGRVVAPGSLTVAISAARRALGDDASRQGMILTCPGRGYRFVPALTATHAFAPAVPNKLEATVASEFLGRAKPLETFRSMLTRPTGSSPRVMLIAGEAGIGKSRLLLEYSRLAASLSTPMHLASCPETERTPFLWPWVQLVEARLRSQPSREVELSAYQRGLLAPLFPDRFEPFPVGGLGDPDSAQFRLFDALATLLHSLRGPGLVVLAIDDLHRADAGTARFLSFAARALQQSPLILLATYRPSEILPSSPQSAALAALAREPDAISIWLKGLTQDETTRLASALSAEEIPSSHAHELYRLTSGNPFFVRQILPILPDYLKDPTTKVPPDLSRAILHRIGKLSASAQAALTTAAAVGRDFLLSTVASASGIDPIEAPIDEAIAAGLVSPLSSFPPSARFVHVLVRDVIYAQLPLAERRSLHLRIGKAIDSGTPVLPERLAADVARHLVASGVQSELQRAIDLATSAGHAASSRSSYEDAAHHFTLATDALAALKADDDRRRCNLLLLKGTAECRAGNRSKAKATFREAADIAAALDSAPELARAALGVAPGFLAAEAGVSDSSLENLLTTALSCLADSDVELRALVAARLAMALHWTDRDERVQELLSIARQCLAQTSDGQVRLHVRFSEWFCDWRASAISERHSLAAEIQDLAERAAEPEMVLVGMVLRMVGMLERSDLPSFDSALKRFEELANHLRQPQCLWYAPMYRSMRALLDGAIQQAAAQQARFSRIAAQVNDANAFHSLAAQLAHQHWNLGTLEQLVDLIADGANRYPTIRGFRAGLAWSYAMLGRMKEAVREFDVLAASSFQDIPQRFDWSTAVGFLSETCAAIGDRSRARLLYDLLLPYANYAVVMGLGVGTFGPAERLLGLLAATMGRSQEAEWHFERAIAFAESRGMPVWSAQARIEHAALLTRTSSSRARAGRLAKEAFSFASAMGMSGLAERARTATDRRSSAR